ncbi:MAG: UDP-N-acetylmuramoyl-tripeptide--D-alanyl-D-alanine ligase [Pseudomonadota bacterium]|nr:UDP-N-acetylmuramoyl-tripeptide--D-alanyl-D-alanine ligase [Pseudomonadota bacterium]
MTTLREITSVLNATLFGDDIEFQGVSTDSRQTQNQQLFFALSGPNFDGHDFVANAAAMGAVAAVVTHRVDVDIPQLVVADTTIALGQLAAKHRQQFNMPIVAITGSCGKTTTTAMLASIFRQCGKTLSPLGSFNNHIGLPLTLLQLDESYQYVVLELGANHLNEIDYLVKIAQPDVAAVTMIAAVHLAGFGSIENIALAKGEIFNALSSDSVAVTNADDPYSKMWDKKLAGHRVVSFGSSAKSDVSARNIVTKPDGLVQFQLMTSQNELTIDLPLLGEHNVQNALAAAACAYAIGVSAAVIKQGLEQMVAVEKRLVRHRLANGTVLIDDSYNANPLAVKAAMVVLQGEGQHTTLVLGDMGELGENAEQFHIEIGLWARQTGIDQLFTYGTLTAHAAQAFGEKGQHFTDKEALVKALAPTLTVESAVLVKGSKSMKMWHIVEALLERQG